MHNKLKKKVADRLRNQRNKVGNALRMRSYRKENPDICRAISRRTYKKNIHLRHAYDRGIRIDRYESSFKGFIKKLLGGIQKMDRKHKRVFDIDVDFILRLLEEQSNFCSATGIKLTHKRRDLRAISVDRIDSKKGHTKDNIQVVCRFFNLGKGSSDDRSARGIVRDIELNAIRRLFQNLKAKRYEIVRIPI